MSATGDPRRRWRGEAGSTLVEALVVVAITATVSTLAYPELRQGMAGALFVQAATGLRADLRMARAQALSTGEPVEIVVAPDGHGYGWTPGPQRALLAGLSLTPTGSAVRFYTDGSADGESVTLSNGRAQVRFAINPVTGLVGEPGS